MDKYSNKLTTEVLTSSAKRSKELSLNARAFSTLYYDGLLNRDNFQSYFNKHILQETEII